MANWLRLIVRICRGSEPENQETQSNGCRDHSTPDTKHVHVGESFSHERIETRIELEIEVGAERKMTRGRV